MGLRFRGDFIVHRLWY